MKSREELIRQQERLLEVYESVKDPLAGYPNVVSIGIGIKETDGQLTEEGCIKIIVSEKKSEADLEPNQVIPKEIEGVKTDIIFRKKKILLASCTVDLGNYRPIKGGIRINNIRNGSGHPRSGTLGCLAKLDSDNSWVILSNHHVLYGDSGQDGDEIGQPWVGCCCCCRTNVIAVNLDKDLSLDCAIAKVKDDIAIENNILEIMNIEGNGVTIPINGERVRKRGATTGLTSGEITYIDPSTKEITINPRPSGGPANDPGGCTNYRSGVNVFAYHGDSGSAIVNNDNEVVALLYSVSEDYSQGFANDIIRVQASLGITINTTSSAPNRVPISNLSPELPIGNDDSELNDAWIEYIEGYLEANQTGKHIKKIIERHQEEVLKLVNKHRPVMVTWQRKQGPAFVAALNRSIKNLDYVIPPEINRVSLQNLLMSMASVLEEHGSEALRKDLQKYALEVIQISRDCHTAEDFLKSIEQFDDETRIQQPSLLAN